MSKVRCKFTCISMKKFSAKGWYTKPVVDYMYEYEFTPVGGGAEASEEDKTFFASTPAGSLKVSCVSSDYFAPGETYYLDITPVQE